MTHEVRDAHGKLLFTHEDLERARNRRIEATWPAWLRNLNWPPGMRAALHAAKRQRSYHRQEALLIEARGLYEAERENYTTAAAAIRHELTTKYGG